jgi:transcriptional regulator with XRE-family HTH domain
VSISQTLRTRELVRSGEARAIRERAGISRLEVARELGVDESTIWRWEKGATLPRGEVVSRYSRLLRLLDGRSER